MLTDRDREWLQTRRDDLEADAEELAIAHAELEAEYAITEDDRTYGIMERVDASLKRCRDELYRIEAELETGPWAG